MPKQMSCSKTIGRAIRKFGLPAVQAAIEMATEITAGTDMKSKPANKPVTNRVIAERKFTQSLGLTPSAEALERAAAKD